jgi:aspartyl-tRNA(Asn)/glutamyl-tRNA(Gln) amidotransferase subunit C
VKIKREDVLRVAELAHLALDEAEIEMYARQLDSILSYVEKLNELDTAAVEPMAQVLAGAGEEANPAAREDEVRAGGTTTPGCAEEVLSRAPDAAPPYFRVPKVIER